jgi:Tfp pilus assembly protein PilF
MSTRSKQAQAFYDQGLASLHSYVWLEAAQSFNQALTVDPKLAMAHAGLAVAYTELNAPAHDKRHLARALQMAAEGSHDPAMLAAHRAALDDAVAGASLG